MSAEETRHDVLILEVPEGLSQEQSDGLSQRITDAIRTATNEGKRAILLEGMKVAAVAHQDGSIDIRKG